MLEGAEEGFKLGSNHLQGVGPPCPQSWGSNHAPTLAQLTYTEMNSNWLSSWWDNCQLRDIGYSDVQNWLSDWIWCDCSPQQIDKLYHCFCWHDSTSICWCTMPHASKGTSQRIIITSRLNELSNTSPVDEFEAEHSIVESTREMPGVVSDPNLTRVLDTLQWQRLCCFTAQSETGYRSIGNATS